MRSKNLKGFAVAVLASMLFLGSGLTAKAQSESAEAHNGLQGTWRLQVTVRNCQTGDPLRPTFPALITFAKGGTLTLTTAGQIPALFTPGLGVWRHSEGNTYSAVSETFVFSPAGAWIQTHRLTRTIEIEQDTDKFTDTIKLEIFDTTGNLIAPGCGKSVASRLKIQSE